MTAFRRCRVPRPCRCPCEGIGANVADPVRSGDAVSGTGWDLSREEGRLNAMPVHEYASVFTFRRTNPASVHGLEGRARAKTGRRTCYA